MPFGSAQEAAGANNAKPNANDGNTDSVEFLVKGGGALWRH
jgi:hypothetical protein